LTFVDPCTIAQFIKENSTRCNNISNFIIPYLYEAQHFLGDTPPIIRSLKLPLVFYTFHVWKTRGCQCRFRLLIMGGVSSDTCWASYKHGIIKFDTLLHLFGYSLWTVQDISVPDLLTFMLGVTKSGYRKISKYFTIKIK